MYSEQDFSFYEFMSPIVLNYLVALHGFTPPALKPEFNYCELGCTSAMTLNTLAAAYSQGHFFVVAPPSEPIDYIQQWATDAQLSNIHFFETEFTKLEQYNFPNFNFISVHNLYSQVSDAIRQHLIHFISQKLAPQGVVMLSYDACPGSYAIQPLRDMLVAYTEDTQTESSQHLNTGYAYLRYLLENQADYLTENPTIQTLVEQILENDADYRLEDLFNAHWKPFYFTEIFEIMAEKNLTFVGTLPLYSNYLDMTLPSAFQTLLQDLSDRIIFEKHKNFINNEAFRYDVYINTTQVSGPQIALFNDFYFGCEQQIPQESITLPNGLELDEQLFHIIIDQLTTQAHTLAELTTIPQLASFTQSTLLEALHILILSGQCRAFAASSVAISHINTDNLTIPNRFNSLLLNHCHFSDESSVYLASPVIGDGIQVSIIDALLLLGLTQTHSDNVAYWVWERLNTAGKNIDISEDNNSNNPIDWLNSQLEQMVNFKINQFVALGCVTFN